MTKKNETILKWRLAEKPTAKSLQDLVTSGILNKEEARQILLDETEFNSKDFDDVLEEVKLLRKLVLQLSERNPERIIRIIEQTPIYIRQTPWVQPYVNWCGTVNAVHNLTGTVGSTTTAQNGTSNNLLG